MPPDGPPPFRRGGGGLTWRRSCHAQRLSLRGRKSSPLWLEALPCNAAPDAGTTRISGVRCGKAKRGCASRVPLPLRRNGAPHERGESGESDPHPFDRWCGTGADKGGGQGGSSLPPVRGGHSHHSESLAGRPSSTFSRSWRVSVYSVWLCNLIVALYVVMCTLMLHRVPLHIRVSSRNPSTSASFLRTQRLLNLGALAARPRR